MRRYGAHAALLLLFTCLFWLNALDSLWYDRAPRKDDRQYLVLAYNIVHHRTFSLDEASNLDNEVAPSAYREPGYPMLLAAGLAASPPLRDAPLARLLDPGYQGHLWPLKHLQMLLLFLTSAAAMAIVWLLTRNVALGYLTLAFVGFSNPLTDLADNFYSETLLVFLFAVFSLALVLAVRGTHRWAFALSGLALAAMALTRAAFQYFWAPCLVFFLLLALWDPTRRRRIVAGAILFLVCFFVPVWSWMARNEYQFGRFYLTERGGVILDIRARTDMMTRAEYLASFLHWSGSGYLRVVLRPRLFDESAITRLDPDSDNGFVRQATRRRIELLTMHPDPAVADRAHLREAMGTILRHPLRHALVTIPVALRGMNVEYSAALSLLLFVLFAAALVTSCAGRDFPAVAALLPAALSFAFHSVLTHNIPRYEVFLIPILWVGAILVLDGMLRRWRPPGARVDADPGVLG